MMMAAAHSNQSRLHQSSSAAWGLTQSHDEEAPAASPLAVPATAPLADDLASVLAAARLSQYEDALRSLGCAEVEDLAELKEAELLELGMKRIEVKRLMRVAH
jgi:hypothetical protein